MKHLDIIWTNQFKKDYKAAIKRHLNLENRQRCELCFFLEGPFDFPWRIW